MVEKTTESTKALVITAIVVAVLVIGLITNGFGLFSPVSPLTGGVINPGIPLEIGNSPVIGNSDAKLTIFEFSDFSCPACKDASEIILPQLIEKYVKTGKAKIVFKYYPGHGTGEAALAVGYALNEQGLFWKYEELAFKNQADTGKLDKMKAIAQSLGADMEKLNAYLNSSKPNTQKSLDIKLGSAIGIPGTPSFVINDKLIVGVEPLSEFERVIDKELK